MGGLLGALLELVAPTRCAGCELPGVLLCDTCRDAVPLIDPASECPRCGAPWGRLVCTECWNRAFAFEAATCLGTFEAPLSRAVVLHKDANERRLAAVLGELLARRLGASWGPWLATATVTWVPASAPALRRRGFDHAQAIAASVAAGLEAVAVPLLVRTGGRDQRVLGRSERFENARGTFEVASTDVPAHVLVIDDVMTTGATLDAAASELTQAGAASVRVAAVARTY